MKSPLFHLVWKQKPLGCFLASSKQNLPLKKKLGCTSSYFLHKGDLQSLLQHPGSSLWHVGSSSLTRGWTQAPCIERASLSHWATREVQVCPFNGLQILNLHLAEASYLWTTIHSLRIAFFKKKRWFLISPYHLLCESSVSCKALNNC